MAAMVLKYVTGGVLGTLCHYTILWIMVTHHINPVVASSCGMIAGAVVVYLMGYHLIFSSSKKHCHVMMRFVPVAGTGFCLNLFILGFTLESLSMPLPLSQVAATAGQFMFGFYFNRRWVF